MFNSAKKIKVLKRKIWLADKCCVFWATLGCVEILFSADFVENGSKKYFGHFFVHAAPKSRSKYTTDKCSKPEYWTYPLFRYNLLLFTVFKVQFCSVSIFQLHFIGITLVWVTSKPGAGGITREMGVTQSWSVGVPKKDHVALGGKDHSILLLKSWEKILIATCFFSICFLFQ